METRLSRLQMQASWTGAGVKVSEPGFVRSLGSALERTSNFRKEFIPKRRWS